MSEDTIDREGISSKRRNTIYVDGKAVDCYISVDEEGKEFCLVAGDKNFINPSKINFYLIDKNHSDYFSLLAPKAVAYGAGVIKLFFDEAEKKKKEQEQKSWWQKVKEKTNKILDSVFNSLPSSSLYTGLNLNIAEKDNPLEEAKTLIEKNVSSLNIIDEGKEEAKEIKPSYAPLPSGYLIAEDSIPSNITQPLENEKIFEEVLPEEKMPEITEKIPSDLEPPSISKPSPSPAAPSLSPSPSFSPLATSTSFSSFYGGSSSSDNSSPGSNNSSGSSIDTTLLSQPSSFSASSSAVFTFSASQEGASFLCQLDDATSTDCVSPQEYQNLSEGSHVFKVAAKTSDGDQDQTPAEYSWVVDLSPPQISNISSSVSRASALISWKSSEEGVFQIEYGLTADYGLSSTTTSETNFVLTSLSPGTDYHFRILAFDLLGNATKTSDNLFSTSVEAENVVISEIKTAGSGGADDEWIELYNPTDLPVDLSGWSIQYRGGEGESFYKKNFTSTSTIPAKGFFLIANSSYSGGVVPDMNYTAFKMSADGGNIFLVKSHDYLTSATSSLIIDKLSYGGGSNLFPEGEAAMAPTTNESLERKASATSTASLLVNGLHQWLGNSYDTDRNNFDFVIQDNPNPQNSLMLSEPRNNLPNLMVDSSWPTWQGNLRRTGLVNVSSLATSTFYVKWSLPMDVLSQPVLDKENNIYILSSEGVNKISPEGYLLWTNSDVSILGLVPSPLILENGTLFLRSAWGLFAINSEGNFLWKFPLSGGTGVSSALAILSDGAIITQSSEKIYAINQDATLKWIFDPARPIKNCNSVGGFVIDSLDNIFFTVDDYLYKISSDGVLLWEKN